VGAILEDAVARRRLSRVQLELDAACSRAVENDRVTSELRKHLEIYERQRNQLAEVVRRTAYLGQLSKEINCLDVDRIVDICINKVSKLVDATAASIYFVNEEGSELTLRQSNHARRISDRLPANSDPARLMTLALDRKAVLLIKDIDALSRSLRRPIDRTYKSSYATPSCIIVPLVSDNKVVAILNLADKANGTPFDEVRDLPLVDHVSQFIGIALRNCQLYQQVWQLAKTDALTGFINHKAFFDELNREVARSKRTNGSLSLILLDVDNFKLFNDVHGHQVGDLILRQVAQLIKGNIRTVDTAARYGGDEFAVILAETDVVQAEVVAERIRRAIAGYQLSLRGQAFCVTISAGIARLAPDRTLADLVSDADAALYRAKSKGRNAIAVCGVS
jgi:diguanylate cyclase (GGDEF)-like protein